MLWSSFLHTHAFAIKTNKKASGKPRKKREHRSISNTFYKQSNIGFSVLLMFCLIVSFVNDFAVLTGNNKYISKLTKYYNLKVKYMCTEKCKQPSTSIQTDLYLSANSPCSERAFKNITGIWDVWSTVPCICTNLFSRFCPTKCHHEKIFLYMFEDFKTVNWCHWQYIVIYEKCNVIIFKIFMSYPTAIIEVYTTSCKMCS